MKPITEIIVTIKGAGEMASAVAWRLYMANLRRIIMLETAHPLAVRRHVCFSEAVAEGRQEVEGVRAVAAGDNATIRKAWSQGCIAVAVDPRWTLIKTLKPDVCVDAIIAKRNLGTALSDAPLVIGMGPGFQAPHDVHMVIETHRGHNLGRIITDGGATPNTGIPGDIGGYTHQRVIRATAKGTFHTRLTIGDTVIRGDTIGRVGNSVLTARIDGCLRGLLPDGTPVQKGCKLGDIDPRGDPGYCATISDKARAISGSVLEGILRGVPTFEVNNRLGAMNDARHP